MQPLQTKGVLADGSQMPIVEKLKLEGKLRDLQFEDEFLVGYIRDEVILGIPFLEKHQCIINFGTPTITINGKTLTCSDRHGNLLATKVQVVRPVKIPPRAEVMLKGRLCVPLSGCAGVIEGLESNPRQGIMVAASYSKPNEAREVFIRCMSPHEEATVIASATCIAVFQEVDGVPIENVMFNQITSGDEQNNTHGAESPRPSMSAPIHTKELTGAAIEHCTTNEERSAVVALLNKYSDVFSKGDDDMGCTNLVEHSIPTKPNTRPIRQPPRRLGYETESEVTRQLKDLESRGLISPADSAWSSPVVLVKKKDNKWRFCVDYRQLNAATTQDAYPLPRIDDSLDALSGSQLFSTLDLLAGYWQLPLDTDARQKSAFVTRNGLWKWHVLPFGLTSAPATFERLMERVLRGFHCKSLLLYLDDIIVFSPDFKSHIHRLQLVFERLRAANLELKPSKCELFKKEVKYLGHVVSSAGVATDPEKVVAVKNWPIPKCLTEVKAFLGTIGYYMRYCPDFASLAKPLHRLTAKATPFQWTPECNQPFEVLKHCIITAPILGYPDPKCQFNS